MINIEMYWIIFQNIILSWVKKKLFTNNRLSVRKINVKPVEENYIMLRNLKQCKDYDMDSIILEHELYEETCVSKDNETICNNMINL